MRPPRPKGASILHKYEPSLELPNNVLSHKSHFVTRPSRVGNYTASISDQYYLCQIGSGLNSEFGLVVFEDWNVQESCCFAWVAVICVCCVSFINYVCYCSVKFRELHFVALIQ